MVETLRCSQIHEQIRTNNVQIRTYTHTDMHLYTYRYAQVHTQIRIGTHTNRHRNTYRYAQVHIQIRIGTHTNRHRYT